MDSKQMEVIQKNALAEYSVTDSRLTQLKEKYSAMKFDGVEGYNALSNGIKEIRGLRTDVEKKRKELKSGAIQWGKVVDSEAKRITESLQHIESPMKNLKEDLDAEKKAEIEEKARKRKERLAKLNMVIDNIKFLPISLVDASPEKISEAITKLEEKELTKAEFFERLGEAQEAKAETLSNLRFSYKSAHNRIVEKAELDILRKQNQEMQRRIKEKEAIEKEGDEIISEDKEAVNESPFEQEPPKVKHTLENIKKEDLHAPDFAFLEEMPCTYETSKQGTGIWGIMLWLTSDQIDEFRTMIER